MKKVHIGRAALVAAAICVATAPSPSLADAVTDTNEVTAVVAGWQSAREALGDQLVAEPASVKAYSGLGGTGTYYVVTLEGGGFVVTSGDTALEPVLAYSKTGEWVDDVKRNPLMAMLEIDVAAASAACETTSVQQQGGGRRLAASSGGSQSSATAAKWAKYKAASGGAQSAGGKRLAATAPSSDLRISPLVQSSWNQSGHGENYYTPNNFVCGCTATMCAQLMRYWKWPTASVTANADYRGGVTYGSDSSSTSTVWTLSGGYYKATKIGSRWTVASTPTAWSPAFGGTYDWANMPLNPTSVKTAIGKLTRDCGIVSMMNYASGGSGAAITLFAHRAVDQFGYANGKCMNGWRDATRDAMLASIDAGIPCGMAVFGSPGGHAIVADGYGYDSSSTLFIHFNMGWGNVGSDTWYTPPAVGSFDSVGDILYNIYPPSKNESDRTIVSGRVLNGSGSAVGGVTVTATNRETGDSFTVTSSNGGTKSFNGETSSTVGKGIYSFMLPAGFYSFTATSGGNSAKVEAQVKPCISAVEGQGTPGNIHGLDLQLGTAIAAPAVALAHRWSFGGTTETEQLADSVGSSSAAKIGSKIAISGGKAVCTGTGAGQGSFNLGSGLLNTDAATIEIWAAPNAIYGGSRIVEYGTGTDSYFMLAWTKQTDIYNDCAELVNNGTSSVNDGTLAPYTLGKQYHISVTFERQPDGSTLVRAMKRDAASGALLRDAVYTMATGIHTISSPLLRLGRSFWNNTDGNATYDEVRVWNGALTDAQLKASVLAGPDANLSTLPWNASAVKYVAKAVWQGGTTAPTASSLASSANWSCTDQNGDAITGVPEARSVVIIPNGQTAFTIPEGYTPAWRKVRFGTEGAATTQLASKNFTASTAYANLNPSASDYTLQGDADISSGFDRRVGAPDTANVPEGLAGKQFRYDGWVNVSAGQAGRWKIAAYADDYAALRIDDEWLAFSPLDDNTSGNTRAVGADVSKGWHRFTLVVSDNYGGYCGCAATTDHATVTPILVSINGGNAIAFTSSNFAFGSPTRAASAVTLTGDCDLSAVDEVALDAGSDIDLAGHTLTVPKTTSSFVGAAITDSGSSGTVTIADGGSIDTANLAVAEGITVLAAEDAGVYIWNGESGADWTVPGNWLLNGSSPVAAPGAGSTVKFTNSSALSVGGTETLKVAKIVTTGAKVTFNCPVAFDGTYLVDNASNAPTFPGGATATKPDDSLAGGSEPNRTLPDGLVFTEDWIVPAAAKGTGKCFIVPAGAHISGKKITGESYTENQPCFRIDKGAVATFTEIPSANHFGFHLNDGRLVVTGSILIDAAATGGDWYHFDYKNGTYGTVETDGIGYSSSGINYIQLNATNYVIGAGGLAMTRSGGHYKFQRTARLTATADMTIAKNGGSNVEIQGGTVLTIDTAGHRIQFDNEIKNTTGKIVKEGEGELVMQTGAKNHTGGTDVKGGTLTVGIANGAGNGTTTVYSGATLAFASAVTSQGKPIIVKNGGTLEWEAAVNDTSTLTLEAGAIVKPKAAAAFTASTVTPPSSGTVTVDLMDVPLTANTAVSILGGVSDASKFTALVPSGVTGSLSIDGTTLVYTPTAVSDVSDADYVWAGANGADWAVASNWRVNGAAPATAPTAKDTIRFDSNATVGGAGTLNVYKVVATGSAAVTFNCPVQFRTTYKVVKGTGAVKFPGGATATYPDASIRTSSSSDLARTLDGVFTFTEDWSMPKVGDNNHPWIIPSGSAVVGKGLTGAEDSANGSGDYCLLRIAQGATATFSTIELGANKGNVDVNGFLEATEAIYVNTASYRSGYLGKSGNTGTVKAPLMTKRTTSEGVYCHIPNLIVGAGGVGTSARDHFWRFMQDTTITATDDFHFLGWYKTSADWGLDLNGKKVTVNVPEGLTVTMGINVYGGGSIRKTGAGKLVMTNTDKNGQTGYVKTYTGGTVIDEGVVYVAAVKDNKIGTGAVTVGANGRLELAPGVTLNNIVKTSTDGAGSIYMGDGSSIAVSADTPCRLASFEVAPGGTATITTSSSANAGAVLLSGVSADSASRLNIPSGFTLAGGMVYVQSVDVALTHRWSFNGTTDAENLTDSVGNLVAKKMKKANNTTTVEDSSLSMTWSDGKVVLEDGNGKGFLDFGELLDPAVGGTIEMWATRINSTQNNRFLASYYIADVRTGSQAYPNDFFALNIGQLTGTDSLRGGWIQQCANNCARTGSAALANKEIMGMVANMPYHVSLTFAPDGSGGTVVRWMIRDAATGFLLSEQQVTADNWTLATATSPWSFAVGITPFMNAYYVTSSAFDEVRSWNGVLSDEQLKASAIAGPDAPLGGGVAGVVIPADTTFDVPTLGGYGYRTDSIVTLGTGAKIRFDTTDYFGTGLRFKAGGIVVPSGSVLDYVELSDGANYTATMEDANTVLVQLKPDIAYESTWKGGTPSSAADLANPANWTSVNAAGEAITAAPGAKTTVILPAASLATFTVPEGAEPVYGRVLLGGHTATQRGRYATKPNAVLSAFREVGLGSYVSVAAEGIEAINGGANTSWQSTYLANGQVRFDGWVYVSAAQAGKWDIKTDFDNLSTFAIDGEWVFINPREVPNTTTAGCFVSEGWHRFTFIAGDTGRTARGCEVTVNGVKVPFSISVNGGAAVAFHTFTFGSDAGTVTLSGDADWRALGELDLAGGVTIDLNGHNLAVADITRSSLGGSIVNGATGLSVLYVAGAADESKAKASGMVASEVLIKTYVGPAADLYWNLVSGLTDWTTSDAAWTNAAGVAKAFIDNANATIADTATINIPSDVTANDVTVSADGDVTLQGAGKIGGSGMFTKGGTGTLTFNATGGLDQQILLVTNGVFKVGNDLTAADALGGSTDDTPIIVKDAGTFDLNYRGDGYAGVTRNKVIHIAGNGYNNQGALVSSAYCWRGISKLVLDDDALIGGNETIRVSNDHASNYVRKDTEISGAGKTLSTKITAAGGFALQGATVTLGELDVVNGGKLKIFSGNTFNIANGVHFVNGGTLEFQNTPDNIPAITVHAGTCTIADGYSGATFVGDVTVASGATLRQNAGSRTFNFNGAVNGLTVAAGTANFNGGADNLKVTGGTANVNSTATGLTVSGGTVNVGAAVTGLAVSGATPGTTLIAVGNGGSIDLTGATVDFKTAPSASFVLATGVSADSFIGALPTPTVNGQRLKGWKVVKSGNDLKLRKASGMMIMVN